MIRQGLLLWVRWVVTKAPTPNPELIKARGLKSRWVSISRRACIWINNYVPVPHTCRDLVYSAHSGTNPKRASVTPLDRCINKSDDTWGGTTNPHYWGWRWATSVVSTDCLSRFRGTEVAYSRCRKPIRITPVVSFPEEAWPESQSRQWPRGVPPVELFTPPSKLGGFHGPFLFTFKVWSEQIDLGCTCTSPWNSQEHKKGEFEAGKSVRRHNLVHRLET